jgi:hypothetical protein
LQQGFPVYAKSEDNDVPDVGQETFDNGGVIDKLARTLAEITDGRLKIKRGKPIDLKGYKTVNEYVEAHMNAIRNYEVKITDEEE